MKHLGTRRLETDRLILRPFVMKDVGAMFENWASDEQVTRYLMWPTHTDATVTEAVLRDWTSRYEEADFYQWAIVPKDGADRPVGSISVVMQDDRVGKGTVGYCIGRPWWHQGITTEALGAVIDFLIHQVGLQRVDAYHDPRNPHSGQVMQNCGMTCEGTLRRSDWNNQGICDACWYAILREEIGTVPQR